MNSKKLEKLKTEIKKLKKNSKKNYSQLLEIYKDLILEYYYLKKEMKKL